MLATPNRWAVVVAWLISVSPAQAAELPAEFDWRANGGNYLPRVRDQGQCASCWAHAALAVMESMLKITAKRPDWDPNLSEQQLVSCGPCGSCEDNCEDLSQVFEFILQQNGVATEADFPYVVSDKVPCESAALDWRARAFQLAAYARVPRDTPSIKQQLLSSPVIFKFTVYQDFFSHSSGVYRHQWGDALGTHYGILVGWSDRDQAWIVRNSWGSDFGDGGYFRLLYEDSNIQKDLGYALQVDLPESFTPPQEPDPIPVGPGCGCASLADPPGLLALWALCLGALLLRRTC